MIKLENSDKTCDLDEIINTIITGDCREVLPHFPSESIDMVITSPPYWKLRDYKCPGQLGREDTPEEYLESLAGVFDQVKRVLKPGGSLWINLGDRYHHKDLLGLPWRLVLELKRRGWILRNACIWHKPNAMPVSVKDRLNHNYENLFHLVKSRDYYYDLTPVRVPHKTRDLFNNPSRRRRKRKGKTGVLSWSQNPKRQPGCPGSRAFHPLGKNPGAFFSITAARSREGHPATFPAGLCRLPILASCPKGGIVLDPFCGTGTALREASSLDRNFIGIERNPDWGRRQPV